MLRSAVALLTLSAAGLAQAGLINFTWDNDLLTGSDRGYTNGVRLSWLGNPAEAPACRDTCVTARVRDRLAFLPGLGGEGRHALGLSVWQAMVTPDNIESREPDYDDLPYVGYLSLEGNLYAWSDRALTGYGVHLGIVGKDSGAERAQKWVHKITGSTDPRGWDHQLGQDLVGGVSALHARRLWMTGAPGALQQEVVWAAGGRVGNFISDAETGFTFRIGRNLPGNFIPEYAGSSPSMGLPGLLDSRGWGWSLFVGLSAQGVAYSYIEEHAEDYRYDQSTWVGHASLGAGVHTRNFHLALTVKASTDVEQEHKEQMRFGTLSLTWKY